MKHGTKSNCLNAFPSFKSLCRDVFSPRTVVLRERERSKGGNKKEDGKEREKKKPRRKEANEEDGVKSVW